MYIVKKPNLRRKYDYPVLNQCLGGRFDIDIDGERNEQKFLGVICFKFKRALPSRLSRFSFFSYGDNKVGLRNRKRKRKRKQFNPNIGYLLEKSMLRVLIRILFLSIFCTLIYALQVPANAVIMIFTNGNTLFLFPKVHNCWKSQTNRKERPTSSLMYCMIASIDYPTVSDEKPVVDLYFPRSAKLAQLPHHTRDTQFI